MTSTAQLMQKYANKRFDEIKPATNPHDEHLLLPANQTRPILYDTNEDVHSYLHKQKKQTLTIDDLIVLGEAVNKATKAAIIVAADDQEASVYQHLAAKALYANEAHDKELVQGIRQHTDTYKKMDQAQAELAIRQLTTLLEQYRQRGGQKPFRHTQAIIDTYQEASNTIKKELDQITNTYRTFEQSADPEQTLHQLRRTTRTEGWNASKLARLCANTHHDEYLKTLIALHKEIETVSAQPQAAISYKRNLKQEKQFLDEITTLTETDPATLMESEINRLYAFQNHYEPLPTNSYPTGYLGAAIKEYELQLKAAKKATEKTLNAYEELPRITYEETVSETTVHKPENNVVSLAFEINCLGTPANESYNHIISPLTGTTKEKTWPERFARASKALANEMISSTTDLQYLNNLSTAITKTTNNPSKDFDIVSAHAFTGQLNELISSYVTQG